MARGQARQGLAPADVLYGSLHRRGNIETPVDPVRDLRIEEEDYFRGIGVLKDYAGGENWMLLERILGGYRSGSEKPQASIPGAKILEEALLMADPMADRGEWRIARPELFAPIQLTDPRGELYFSATALSEASAVEQITPENGRWLLIDLREHTMALGVSHALMYVSVENDTPLLLGMVLTDQA